MNKPKLYYGVLSERAGAANAGSFDSILDVVEHGGANNYQRMHLGYSRTDYARNEFVKGFLSLAVHDNDLLVMIDCDHKYPADILTRFLNHSTTYGVVGALAFRRGEPYDPLFFVRSGGGLHSVAEFEYGPTYQCAIVSTSAISIRKWVFIELMQRGYNAPFFRYEYPTDNSQPSEDMYFGRICEQSGIWHYCDTTVEIPHATTSWVDHEVYEGFLKTNPNLVSTEKVEVLG